jgi:pimeloyl-ACP methyl ester carboxylesterase
VRVDEHTIDLGGTPVYYRTAGEAPADIPVLYLHGLPTSSDDWLPFLELTGGIAPDLIGFGRSGKAGNLDYSLDGHADFIEQLLETLEVERVQLVAHDWGAGGGLAFAQRHPERIDRLVLIDALPLAPGFSHGRFGRIWRRPVIGELVMGSVTKRLLARALRNACTTPDAWPADRVEAVWDQFDQGTQRAILRLHRATGPEQLAAAGAQLDTIEAPALILWGEHDKWLAPRYSEQYAGRLANATAQPIPAAGHWPWLDRPDVIETVATFLEWQ